MSEPDTDYELTNEEFDAAHIKAEKLSYFAVPRSIFGDETLTYGARGLLGHILSIGYDEEIAMADLIDGSPGGRYQVRGFLRELMDAGLVHRKRFNNQVTGRFEWYYWTTLEPPSVKNRTMDQEPPSVKNRTMVPPGGQNGENEPSTENPPMAEKSPPLTIPPLLSSSFFDQLKDRQKKEDPKELKPFYNILNIKRAETKKFKPTEKDPDPLFLGMIPQHFLLPDLNFLENWIDWYDFRKEVIGKPLTRFSAKRQLNLLGKFNAEVAIAMLDQSMSANWQGLFELKPWHPLSPQAHSEPLANAWSSSREPLKPA